MNIINLLLEFAKVYWLDIIIAVVFLGVLAYLYKIGKKDWIRRIILSLVVQAEKELGSGTGELKYAFVVERVYSVLPISVKWLITKREMDDLIEEAVQYLKAYLNTNKNLLGYTEEFYNIEVKG